MRWHGTGLACGWWRKGVALQRGVPEELAGEVSPEEYDVSRQYNVVKNRFGYFSDAYHLVLQVCGPGRMR